MGENLVYEIPVKKGKYFIFEYFGKYRRKNLKNR